MRADPPPAGTPRAPYGTWPARISADMVARQGVRLSALAAAGNRLYWLEGRPAEAGRRTVMGAEGPDSPAVEILASGYNAGSRVHEYGGHAACLTGTTLAFVNFADQRLYSQAQGPPKALTPASQRRFAEPVADRRRHRLICVCEDHGAGVPPQNRLVAVAADGSERLETLVDGADFLAYPRLSPDGGELAWIAWDQPDMPWDATRLWRAPLDATGRPGPARCVAGGVGESVVQPLWGPDGTLYFISDRSGWWQIYADGGPDAAARRLCDTKADFARPLWQLGETSLAVLDERRLACAYRRGNAASGLAVLDTATGALTDLPTPGYTAFSDVVATTDGDVAAIAAGPGQFPAVIAIRPTTGELAVVRRAATAELDAAVISHGEPIAFPTPPADGPAPDTAAESQTAYGLYYAPKNPDVTAPADELPPLIVRPHGGPTGQFPGTLTLGLQFWTARGFAVAEIDYRGSSGYGRTYRDALLGGWGIVDLADCLAAARYLCQEGRADPQRLIIAGGSAGGFTVLAALTGTDAFAAGASYYGVSDLETLRQETHKFERRYLDRLIGPYPEHRDLFHARAPLTHADWLASPTIFFQGGQDRVVPPNQAERMVAALRRAGLPVAYSLFADEGHGFRQAATIRTALLTELAFYGQVLGFTPADRVPAVPGYNMP